METDKMTVPGPGQEVAASTSGGKIGRFFGPRSRRAIVFGAIFLTVAFIIFKIGHSQATSDAIGAAAQSINSQASPRAYQFIGQGKILGGSGETWSIGGLPVVVGNQTQLGSEIHPGETVSLLGHITKNGVWQAERIQPISDNESFFSFAGPLESRSPNVWQIAGISVSVNENTQVAETFQDQELVLVTFNVLSDGAWLALRIESLSDSPGAVTLPHTPTPTVSPTPPAKVAPQTYPTIKPGKGNECKGNKGGKGHGNGRGKCNQKHGGGEDEGD